MDNIKELEKKVRNSSGEEKLTNLNDLAFALNVSDPEKTEYYAQEALELATRLKSKPDIARSYNIIGISYHRRGNYNEALKYYHKALHMFRQLKMMHKIAGTKNNIGGIYEKLGNYDKALEYYLRALRVWDQAGDKAYVAACCNNIGIIYEKQGSYDEALNHHLKSLKIKEEIGSERDIAISLNNIGIVYERQDKHDLALEYLLKALYIKEKSEDKHSVAVSYVNIGNIYIEKGEQDLALSFLKKSNELFNETKDPFGDVTSLTSLGNLHTRKKDFQQAFDHLKKALDIARSIKAKGLELNALDSLFILFEEQEDFKQALFYHKKFSELKGELFNDQQSKQIAEMRTKYETEQKEREAEIYRLKNVELAKANEMVNIKNRKLETRERQLTLLNKILRHDIINNLSVIDAALKLYRKENDESLLDEAFSKVEKSIMLINKMREQEDMISSEDLKIVEISDIINKVIKHYPEIEFTVTGHDKILADDAIDSVIDNIISNAAVHSETLKIDITITSDNDNCSIKIADYGKGIPDKIKDKIFDEGFVYGKKGHTGIGLYIVRESVKRWGGTISVEDNEPNGAVFILHLASVRSL